MIKKLFKLLEKLHNPFIPRWFDRSVFDFMEELPDDITVFNIGSGNTKLNHRAINLDIKQFPNVDIIGDAHYLPFKDNSLGCVFCIALLEHVQMPWAVAGEIQRVLKRGGTAYVVSPFLEAVHDEHDYFRFTLKGLKSLFPELREIKSGISASAGQTFADFLRIFPVLVVERTWLNYPMRFVMGWLAKPFQHMDSWIRKSPSMSMYARAFYFIGVKQ
jgi:SAM-dependent methyltransferase